MNTKLLLSILFTCFLFRNDSRAQAPILLPKNPPISVIQYTYDAAGNRIKREQISINLVQLKTTNDSITEPEVKGGSETKDEDDEQIVDVLTNDLSIELPMEEEASNEAQQEETVFESKLSGSEVKIYPNPVFESLRITIEDLSIGANVEIVLRDMSGKLLERVEYPYMSEPISFLNYSVGTYVLIIRVNDERKEWLIVKQ